MEAILNEWNPKNESVVTTRGFRYLDTKIVITGTKKIEANTEIELFEQFYKLNNNLRYCNNSYLQFQSLYLEKRYNEWLLSDDYKRKSFNLYYGNGIVD